MCIFLQKRVDLIVQFDVLIIKFDRNDCNEVTEAVLSISGIIHNSMIQIHLMGNNCAALIKTQLKVMCLTKPIKIVLEKLESYVSFACTRLKSNKEYCKFVLDICAILAEDTIDVPLVYTPFTTMLSFATQRLVEKLELTDFQVFVSKFVSVFKKLCKTDSHQQLCVIISSFATMIPAATAEKVHEFTSAFVQFSRDSNSMPEVHLACTIALGFRKYFEASKGAAADTWKSSTSPVIYMNYVMLLEIIGDVARDYSTKCTCFKGCKLVTG